MTFLNPIALVGLIAAGIPVLLHLLNLRKVRIVEFSTLSFLKELQPTTLRRLRIRQLLLLFLRTLLIILLVLAFSRPTLKGSGTSDFGARAKTTAVIAIDDSPSMERHDRNGALWRQATGAAATVLGLLQDGDEIVLLPFSAAHSPSGAPEGEGIRGIARARSALGDLRPGTVSPSLRHVLRAGAKTLALSHNAQRELYLISDFQEGLLSADTESAGDGQPIALDGVRAYGIPIGDGTSSNLGITGARIANSILEQGKAFTLAVSVTNSSTTDIRNSVVSVFLNGNRVTAKAVDVEAGTSPTFDIPVVAGGPGFVNGRVSLDDDDFPFDNVRYFSLNLRRELRVLLVGPSPSLRYLRAAIETRSSGGPTVRLDEIPLERLSASSVRAADVIILANTAVHSITQVSALREFVEAGGGMIYFPGPLIDARAFQVLMGALGGPELRGFQTTQSAGSPEVFDKVDRRHPIFQQMFQPRIGDDPGQRALASLESPRIWTHAVFGVSARSQSVVTLTDGSPFLVDFTSGEGRVMLFAIGAEPDWSDFPFKGLFVPLLLRSLSYAAQEQAIMPETIVGSLAPSLKRLQVHAPVTIQTPSGNKVTIPRLDTGEESGPLGLLTELGIYDVTANSTTLLRFAVNGSPSESYVRPLRREEVGRAGQPGGSALEGLTWVDDPRFLERLVVQARLGSELWPLVVIGALAVSVIELLVARSVRSHGPTENTPHPRSIP